MDAVADAIEHVQQTCLHFLLWRFAVELPTIFEYLGKAVACRAFLVRWGEGIVDWPHRTLQAQVL